MFSHVVGPPRSRRMTWSRFRSFGQKRRAILAVFLSRSNDVVRVEI